MYSEVFCKVYNELGWNYYPEAFGEQLLRWMARRGTVIRSSMDLGCGTGVLCEILHGQGIHAWGTDLSEGMIAVARERNPEIPYAVENMVTYRPDRQFDLVTCTGDALNHIPEPEDLARIFENVYHYLAPGGYFVFDILDEHEVSDSEPFEMDFSETVRVWFQMTRPTQNQVQLKIRVLEAGKLTLEEDILETVHAPDRICALLSRAGFAVERLAHSLLEEDPNGTTWYVIARKP